MTGGAPHPIDELLRHAGFLRELARDLCADATLADDLVQEVWLHSLRRPPVHHSSLRGWLATLARRLASNQRRGERRRIVRDAAADPREPVPTPELVVAREQIRERLVGAVLALDAPFRDALLLRYYEGIEPKEIARRLRIPAATVRTRIKRGLDKLRLELDTRHGGDRSEWVGALALVASSSGPTSLGAASVLITMKKLLVAVAAVVLVAVLVELRIADAPTSDPPVAPRGRAIASDSSIGTGTAEPTVSDGDARTTVATSPPPASDLQPRVFPAERGVGAVHGVLVEEDGAFCSDVEVRWRPRTGHFPPGMSIRDDRGEGASVRTGAHGEFAFASLPRGPIQLEARRDGALAQAQVVVDALDPLVTLVLAAAQGRGDDLRLLVVDGAGVAVPGASVQVFAWSTRSVEVDAAERSRERPLCSGISDAQGFFGVKGAAIDSGVAVASSADGRVGSVSLWNPRGGTQEIRVTLGAPGTIRGEIRGVSAEDLRGAEFALHQLASFEPYYTSGGRRIAVALDGTHFELVALPAGTYGLTLDAPHRDPGGVRLLTNPAMWGSDPMPNSIDMPRVEVKPGAVSELDLRATVAGAIRGEVRCAGRPVAGVRVHAVLAPATSNFPDGLLVRGVPLWRLDTPYENAPHNPVSHRLTQTDANGVYDLRGLAPGAWRIELSSPALSWDCRSGVVVADGESVALRHDLEEAGVLQVATLDVGWLGVVRKGDSDPRMLAVTLDSIVTFPGLPAGEYTVAGFGSDPTAAPREVGEVTVVAGRTTWADLRDRAAQCIVRGRVTSAGVPVGKAGVSIYPAMATTRDDGRFELRLGHELWFRDGGGALLTVDRNGGSYRFVPAVADPVRDANVELDLGADFIDVELRDARGVPCGGRVEVDWHPPEGRIGELRSMRFDRRVGVDGRVRIGPLPSGFVHGVVESASGMRLPVHVELPRAEPLRVVGPASAELDVRVTRGGVAVADARITTRTWCGDGAPPPDTEAWGQQVVWGAGRTDRDGRARMRIAAGEVLVESVMGGFSLLAPARQRIHISPHGSAEVELVIE
ncbi:MAG: sigma-70 family RNA polymerase sigma factor [Planctomycetota bacterium]